MTDVSVEIFGAASHGNIELSPDGAFVYTPDPGFLGEDEFDYQLLVDSGPFGVGLVTIGVRRDSTPLAIDDVFALANSPSLTVEAPGVLGNDPQASALSMKTTLVDVASHGTVELDQDGSFTYTPDVGFSGSDTFSYRAASALLDGPPSTETSPEARDVGVVTINVVAPITASDDRYQALSGVQFDSPTPGGVLFNDADPSDLPLSAVLVSDVARASLNLLSGGDFTYVPDAGYNGPDTFTYKASNGTAESAPATVTFDVLMNPSPRAVDDWFDYNFYTVNGSAREVAAPGVLRNDRDPHFASYCGVARGRRGAW